MFQTILRKIRKRNEYSIPADVNEKSGQITLRRGIEESYRLLKLLGISPRVVFDVGVATGTPDLYSVFSAPFYVLVEPLDEYDESVAQLLKQLEGVHVKACAGENAGEASIHVHDYHLEGSSLLKETMGAQADGFSRNVEVTTLDEIERKHSLQGPYMVKIDVQGAELEVLAGAFNVLKNTQVVILEVSFFKFMKGQPEFVDVILYMKEKGFVPWDIIQMWNRPLDGALGQADVVFVRDCGPLRSSHAYSTVTQMNDKWK